MGQEHNTPAGLPSPAWLLPPERAGQLLWFLRHLVWQEPKIDDAERIE